MNNPITTAGLIALIKEYERAEKDSKKAAERRASMGPGSCVSRKGTWTTTNATWRTKAEARDQCLARLQQALAYAQTHGIQVPGT